jgi:phosphohistidine phosphatase
MMKLYLVRHGEAKNKSEDPQRSLTDRGKEEVARVAAYTLSIGTSVVQIHHSGKRRAEETAFILGEYLSPSEGVISVPGLAPNDDVRPMIEMLNRQTQPLMLVSHLPFLGRLASQLISGNPNASVAQFQTGGVVALVRENGDWTLNWVISPDQIP